MREEVLRVQNLSAQRIFGCDLQYIYMNLYVGEALGIVGLHDSGKSFLLDCLMGNHQAEEGKIFLHEEPADANKWKGSDKIFRIGEKSALVETFSVMENVFIIRKQKKRKALIPWQALKVQATVCMQEFGISIDPEINVSELSLLERHIVEILKAYIAGARVILIDDVLTPYVSGDYKKLYNVIERFQEKGISFVICGCQLEKLQTLTERCLFMVNGKTVKTIDNVRRHQVDEIKILMEGGNVPGHKEMKIEKKKREIGKVIFEAKNIATDGNEKMDFRIREGEIVVFVDFFGQWIPPMLESIKGQRKYTGTFSIIDRPIKGNHKDVYIADFLQSNYMIGSLSFRDNLCLAAYKRISTLGFLHPGKAKAVEKMFKVQYEINDERYTFEWEDLSFGEKMAVHLERIKLQKWKVMFCMNMENVMSYELEDMIKRQLRDMVRVKRSICICSPSFEKFADVADYYLVMTEQKRLERFTYSEIRDYLRL